MITDMVALKKKFSTKKRILLCGGGPEIRCDAMIGGGGEVWA